MTLSWIAENPPLWDADKMRIVGQAPAGIFDTRYSTLPEGEQVPGEWWRVEDDGKTLGYGWLELVWGDAEILLATDPEARGRGVGGFALENLAKVAAKHGVNYINNIVRPTHPAADELTAWLTKREFKLVEDGRLVRRVRRDG